MYNARMATIIYIIAKTGFRDEEYFIPKEVLIAAGHTVVTGSNGNTGESAIGSRGGEALVDMTIADVQASVFDAVIFAGGPGALENLDNKDSYRIVREAVAQGKLLGAICIAPTILAHAGVLQGKKATVWSSATDTSPITALKEWGAKYVDAPVTQDGAIITANRPKAAQAFGEALVAYLS